MIRIRPVEGSPSQVIEGPKAELQVLARAIQDAIDDGIGKVGIKSSTGSIIVLREEDQ